MHLQSDRTHVTINSDQETGRAQHQKPLSRPLLSLDPRSNHDSDF